MFLGFLEYAWQLFFDKDRLHSRLLVSPKAKFPQLRYDDLGFSCIFPEPIVVEDEEGEKSVSVMGYSFPPSLQGKGQLVTLFRACVFHLGAHSVISKFSDYADWRHGRNKRLAEFTVALVEDVGVNAFIQVKHADKLVDVAFANALAVKRLNRVDRLMNPATKTMAGLLLRMNTGQSHVTSQAESDVIEHLAGFLGQFMEKVKQSLPDESANLRDDRLSVADVVYDAVENVGMVLEQPFLPHTEELGTFSLLTPAFSVSSDVLGGDEFNKCLSYLGGVLPSSNGEENGKVAEAEASSIFETQKRASEKDRKILSKYENFLSLTSFKTVEMPEQDYSRYLRVKTRCRSEAHRLIESLLVARDALDEDPQKMYGALDLQEVIQVVASKSPKMDVFMLDENISKSYSWVILLDASKSMHCIRDFAEDLLLVLAEVANELLLDPHSWGMYAFNDKFFVIKDPEERYNTRVKSRLGGIRFEGFTYIPDALKMAGKIIRKRSENLKLITVVSDGWPYGYQNIDVNLSETLKNLTGGCVSVIGIGVQSRRASSYLQNNCAVYNLRDLSRKFASLYFEASRIAVET